jgi:hypothetical protein
MAREGRKAFLTASSGIASHNLNAIMMPIRANIAGPPGIMAKRHKHRVEPHMPAIDDGRKARGPGAHALA